MQELRRSLPAYKEKEALLNAISSNQVWLEFIFKTFVDILNIVCYVELLI